MRYTQPQSGPLTLDPANKFVKKLAFVSCAGMAQDPVSGKLPAVQNNPRGANKLGIGWKASGSGQQTEYNLAPLVTSDGVGTGDFTMFYYGDAPTSGSVSAVYSQKNDALGSPYTQCVMYLNAGNNAAATVGKFSFYGYTGGWWGAESDASQVDGKPHLFMAVRRGGLIYLYRDGISVPVTRSGTQTVTIWAAGQKTAIGHDAGSTNYPHTGVMNLDGSMNYGMTDADAAEFFRNPWQIFKSPQRLIFAPAAGGFLTYSYTGTGGISLSGAATRTRGAVKTGTGGITMAGSAPQARGTVKTGSGGIALAGTAAQARGRAFTGSGGLSLGGVASVFRGAVRAASGGISLAGTAAVSATSALQTRIITPVGGFVLAGSAAVVRGVTRATSGGIALAGVAGVVIGYFGAAVGNWISVARHRRRD